MADETKTQIPKPTRQRGPMGRMRRGEKAKDFKGTMRQLLGYIGQHKIAVFAAVAFAVCSVIFNIVGPKVLGQVTTKLFEGLVAKVNGTGDVDFNWIAKTLGFLLCLYLASSVCSLIQGWLMTGVTQKICYRMRKEMEERFGEGFGGAAGGFVQPLLIRKAQPGQCGFPQGGPDALGVEHQPVHIKNNTFYHCAKAPF